MSKPTPARFALGTCRITPAALAALAQLDTQAPMSTPLLAQHLALAPGALSRDGIAARLQAIEMSKRIYSLFEVAPGVLLRVITEADRSATVICTAEEF